MDELLKLLAGAGGGAAIVLMFLLKDVKDQLKTHGELILNMRADLSEMMGCKHSHR